MTLYGLILCGGNSSRFRSNKALVNIGGKTQYMRIQQVLDRYCSQVFISCKPDQIQLFNQSSLIIDSIDAGPMSGILSAFDTHSDVAWLICNCDWTTPSYSTIDCLTEALHSNHAVDAIAFKSEDQIVPFPCIITPRAFQKLSNIAETHQYSLKSCLETIQFFTIEANNMHQLLSFNTEEELTQQIGLWSRNNF